MCVLQTGLSLVESEDNNLTLIDVCSLSKIIFNSSLLKMWVDWSNHRYYSGSSCITHLFVFILVLSAVGMFYVIYAVTAYVDIYGEC